MNKTSYSLEQLLIILGQIPQVLKELNDIKQILLEKDNSNNPEDNHWFDIVQLCNYLPGNPAKATIYGKVHNREIPHKKIGKRLAFLKSEIDEWLKAQGRKTASEIEAEAEAFIQSKYKKG